MLWLDPRPHMRRQSCRRLGQVAPEARSRPWGSAIPARPGQRPTRFATCLRGGDRLRGQMESVNRPGRPRIMVIARGHLGDIVTALPALRDLRAGYPEPGLAGRLLTHDLGPEPRVQSNRLTNAALVRALGLEASPVLPRLSWVPEADQVRADEILAERGITTRTRFAVFQIAAHWGCYEWSSEKWGALADHLALRHDLKVVVVGTGEDFELRKFADLSCQSTVPASIQGLTSLPMLFHVVSRAALVVAADSALTQIAIAQRIPAVILFGIEPQVRNGPLSAEAGDLTEQV